jgi:hypothetical protein
MGGNVREWSADRTDFARGTHAARSSGYRSTKVDDLILPRRSDCHEDRGNDTLGFRIVLDKPSADRAALAARAEAAMAQWRAAHTATGPAAWYLDDDLRLRIDLTAAAPLRSAAAFAGLPIAEFSATLAPDADLSALRGLPLVAVRLVGALDNLAHFSGENLEWLALDLSGYPAPDLGSLSAPSLRGLAIHRAAPLPAWPQPDTFPALRHLDCEGSRLPDLAGLAPHSLDFLGLDRTGPVAASVLAKLTGVRRLPAWPSCFRMIDEMRDRGHLTEALGTLADFTTAVRPLPWFDATWRGQISFREARMADPVRGALEAWQADRATWPPPGSERFGSSAFAVIKNALRPGAAAIEVARLGAHAATLSGPEEAAAAAAILRAAGNPRPAFIGGTRPRPDLPWAWVTAERWNADSFLPQAIEDDSITLLLPVDGSSWLPASHRSVGYTLLEWPAPDAPDPWNGLAERLLGAWRCAEDGNRYEFLPHGRIAGRVFDESCWIITRASAGEVLLLMDYNRSALLLTVPEEPASSIPAITPDGSRRTLVR